MRRCDGCSEAIRGARSDAVYCSSACRQQAYRDRRRFRARWGDDPDEALRQLMAELQMRGYWSGVTDLSVTHNAETPA